MLDTAAHAHFHAVFVSVWSRGYRLWRGAEFERQTVLQANPVSGERDVLTDVPEEARPRGIAVVP